MPRWAIIGAPADKRTRGFTAALAACGQGSPVLITWPQVAADAARALAPLAPGDVLRIDSPGADAAAWSCLAERGGGGVPAAIGGGRWQPGARRHAGLGDVLDSIGDAAARAGLRLMADPVDIKIMCDKAHCRDHLARAGIRIPAGLPDCRDVASLHAMMAERGWLRVFIKPRWGSSGAGVIAYRRASMREDARSQAITTLTPRMVDGVVQFFNAKRLRTFSGEGSGDTGVIHAMIGAVLADGAVVEQWIPKIAAQGGPADLRIVTIDGRPRHAVARVGSGPITNLHLDAARMDAEEFLGMAAPERAAAVLATATAVAKAFPASLYLGVDLLITDGFRDCLVGEVNAWGDLLPGLEHGGEDTFSAEIRAVLARQGSPCPA